MIRWKIIIAVLVCFLIVVAGFGYFAYKKITSSFEIGESPEILQSLVSLDLPPGHKVVASFSMMGFKMATIGAPDKKRVILIMGMPGDAKISNDDFGKLDAGGTGYSKDFLEGLQSGSRMKVAQVHDRGVYRLADGTEVPFIIGTFENKGRYSDGFMGVINFAGSARSVMLYDQAEQGKYDFDATRQLLDRIGPPVITEPAR